MTFKFLVLCVVIASVKAGVLHSALRVDTPILATAPASVRYEIPPTSKVEHLASVVSTSYGYSTFPIKHEVVAPAVKIAEPAPAIHVQVPAVHVQTPAITRVEHLAPAVASSYRTEVINPPKVHITHTPAVAKIEHVPTFTKIEHVPTIAKIEHVPTIAKIEHVPTIAKIEHVPTIAKIEHVPTIAKIEHAIPAVRTELFSAPVAHVSIAQPTLRFETPTITKVEHFAPSVSSFTKPEVVSAPAVRYETHHSPLLKYETPAIATVEHLAKTAYISEPSLRVASFDHSLHGLSLKHFGHSLVF